ncbi:MAG TPA: ParA family protein [Anaerolineales bacterium]|nr:ParA family protein [Anaerolineales bacterium]
MTCIIAVGNQKGGVAKTTTVMSLGGALAEMGHAILLVDLDAQANLTLSSGVDPSKLRGTIADVLLQSANLYSVSRETSIPGLDIVPANAEMDLAERFLPVRNNYQSILRSALDGQTAYDYVLLDCPPSIGAVTQNALNAAQLLIIPTQAEYFSAHALRAMLGTTRRIRQQNNPALETRILITMFDQRNRIHREISEQLRSTFGDSLFDTYIQVDTKLRESAVAGVPITHFLNHTRGTLQYRALAQEILQHVQATAQQPD